MKKNSQRKLFSTFTQKRRSWSRSVKFFSPANSKVFLICSQ